MAYTVGSVVTRHDIMDRFISKLINVVLSGNITTRDEGYSPYIPGNILGTKSEITVYATDEFIGARLMSICGWSPYGGDAPGTIYGGLVYITKLLLKVGTWSCHIEDTGRTSINTGGKCLFSTSTVLNCFRVSKIPELPISPPKNGINMKEAIKLSSIENFIQNVVNAYNSAPKIRLDITDTRCHADCHTDTNTPWECHQDYWHKDGPGDFPGGSGDEDHCYANGPWVYGAAADSHWNSSPQEDQHTDTGTSVNTCHSNYSRLSLTNSYGGCNTVYI